MSYVIAAVAIVGAGVQMYGQRKAAKAQEEAAAAQAAAKRLQAQDMLERFAINTSILERQCEMFKQNQLAAFASGGVDIGTGTPLVAMEQTNSAIQQQIAVDKMEVDSKVSALRAGADVDERLGGDIRKASQFQQVGTFLTGMSIAARNAGGGTKKPAPNRRSPDGN